MDCLNCGAALTSAFCAECGQRVVPAHPTLSELAGDAFAELSGWDGKFVMTFRTLLTRPGELTRQFVEGKRVRFIAPVRLYLTVSLVYFIVAASTPILRPIEMGVSAGSLNVGVTTGRPRLANGIMTDEDRRLAQAEIATAPRIMRPILQRAVNDPAGFRQHLFENLPRVMFLLVPILAAIVGLFYRGRHYPEHLYFAIHVVTFVFLISLVAELTKFTYSFPVSAVASIIVQLSIPVYGFFALRRVYGGSAGLTIAKEAGIAALYGVSYACVLLTMLYYVAVSG
jgi:hypothetical protein